MSPGEPEIIMDDQDTAEKETFVADPFSPTTPSIMDRLPLELATLVMENLVEYNVNCVEYSTDHVEQPASEYESRFTDGQFVDWLTFTEESILAILEARLSCSKLYHASTQTFAKVLGNRTFRYTKCGMEDLLNISQRVDLVPYMTTLTIGLAGLIDELNLKEVENQLFYLSTSERYQIAKNFERCVTWQHEELPLCEERLINIFKNLSGLTNVRIRREMLESGRFTKSFTPSTLGMLEKYSFWQARFVVGLYKSDVVEMANVISALKDAKINLRDFRTSQGSSYRLWKFGLPVCNLHTLRITIKLAYSSFDEPSSTQLARLLASAMNIEDLTLRSISRDGYQENSIYLDALADHSNLRRICFLGPWNVYQEDLVPFVSSHANTIRCLIFDDPILVGSWSDTLRAISRTTQGTLEYFRATRAREIRPDANLDVDEPHSFEVKDEDFDDFLCPVLWGKP